jgi:hypothetical protein
MGKERLRDGTVRLLFLAIILALSQIIVMLVEHPGWLWISEEMNVSSAQVMVGYY